MQSYTFVLKQNYTKHKTQSNDFKFAGQLSDRCLNKNFTVTFLHVNRVESLTEDHSYEKPPHYKAPFGGGGGGKPFSLHSHVNEPPDQGLLFS